MKGSIEEGNVCNWLGEDGGILPGSVVGNALGFTKEKFDGWLWKTGNRITISFVESKDPGKGHLRDLMDTIELSFRYELAVPTPMRRMVSILEARGFKPVIEETDWGPCEVWLRP